MNEPVRVNEPDQETVNLLLVDDRRENLTALAALLTRPDYKLVLASSGDEALAALLRDDFAVILLDVAMPEMDGFETARLIKERPRSRHTPIIFVTASIYDGDRLLRGYSIGAVDYLHKPVEAHIVRGKVAVFVELYRQRRRLAQQAERIRAQDRMEHELSQLRADAALRERDVEYESTFSQAPVGIGHINAAGDWLRANRRLLAILGYPKDELFARPFSDILHPKERELLHVPGKEPVFTGEYRCLHKSGRVLWAYVSVTAIHGEAVDARRYLVILADVSERRREDELRELKSRASDLLLASLDYSTSLAAVARAATPLLADACLIDVCENELFRRVAAQTSTSVSLARLHESATDEERTLVALHELGFPEISHVVFESRGETLGRLTLANQADRGPFSPVDMRYVRELGQSLALAVDNARLYAEATTAVRARDEFLSIASHELRTPLTPLLILIQRLLGVMSTEDLRTLQRDKIVPMLQRCERQVKRLAALIDNLLDVSRIGSLGLSLTFEDIDLGELTRDVISRFSDELSRAGCQPELHLTEGVVGHWDRLRIEQVLTNLLTNAIKYGAGKPIEVRSERTARGARLAITDHGIGIPEEKLGAIFECFERAVPAHNYGGLGLGLYISRQIVWAHDGALTVQSKLGEGSTFMVDLPLRPALSANTDSELQASLRRAP